jgi:hypothetical protein
MLARDSYKGINAVHPLRYFKKAEGNEKLPRRSLVRVSCLPGIPIKGSTQFIPLGISKRRKEMRNYPGEAWLGFMLARDSYKGIKAAHPEITALMF